MRLLVVILTVTLLFYLYQRFKFHIPVQCMNAVSLPDGQRGICPTNFDNRSVAELEQVAGCDDSGLCMACIGQGSPVNHAPGNAYPRMSAYPAVATETGDPASGPTSSPVYRHYHGGWYITNPLPYPNGCV